MSFTVDKVSADGAETEYIRFGNGKRELVIIPGLSIKSVIPLAELIERQYGIFSNDFTVYLFDRRKKLPKPYSVSDMADDTARVMKALGISDACVFGASQGGMIAMFLACRYPELVGRAAFGSSACRLSVHGKKVTDEWISLAEKGETEELVFSFAKAVYPENVFEQQKDSFKAYAQSVTKEELGRFIILAEGMNGFDASEMLKDISVPILVIGNTDDAVLGKESTDDSVSLLKDNENAEFYVYNGFGHASYDTAPDYAERLFSFFTKQI